MHLIRKLRESDRATEEQFAALPDGNVVMHSPLLSKAPDAKLKERTVAYRPFPALRIFRDRQRVAVGDSVAADSWDYL
jgi:hypothetical protein